MKKVLAIVVLLGLAAVAAVVPGKIKEASSQHEQRMFAAVDTLGRSLRALATGDNLKVAIYSPEAEFDDDTKIWSVSGIVGVATRSGSLGGPAPSGNELFERFSAQLRDDCKEVPTSACLRVEELTVGGTRVVDIGQTTTAIPGLSSMPLEAGNRTPSLIEMQAEMAPRLPVEDAKMPGPPPHRPAESDSSQTRPMSAEETKQEANAPSGGNQTAARESGERKGIAAPKSDGVSDEVIVQIKRGLKRLGYDPGPINSRVGAEAFSAIMAYQRRYEFSLDGKPSLALLKHIQNNKSDSIY
ncbi:MAG: peptidoglycan-binding domain-containing protein [Alphaproteobacteria bacterium]